MSDQQDKAVLVVDDDALILADTQASLEEAGFHVMAADSYKAALAALERDRARNLVGLVTDIRLGGPQTGWDIAHKARQLAPGLPVIYMTGDSANDWSANGVPHSTLITKPFATVQVVVALSTLLNQPGDEG